MVEQIILVVGLFFLIAGVGLYLHPNMFKKIMGDYMGSPALVYFHGALALIVGAFIILNHNIWEWDMQVVITIVGWVALIRGLWILLAQDNYLKTIKSFMGNQNHVKAEAVTAIIIGAVLLYSYRALLEGLI
ncbi:MAG TPA: hypothetical protein PKD79_04435 [Candidatus Doudnabacteria bacterium]|nr:hypothetical protein [Candidatus Doudnabacteria bacterium]